MEGFPKSLKQIMLSGQVFDVSEMIELANKSIREPNDMKKLNQFIRVIYQRYILIRDVTNQKKCRKMSLDDVQKEYKIEKINQFISTNVDEVEFILAFTQKYISIVS